MSGAIVAILVTACVGTLAPSSPSAAGPSASARTGSAASISPAITGSVASLPGPSGAADAQVGGAWRSSAIPLSDSQIAIISDACAASARESFGQAEADLPTAVIDARGEGLTTAILADGTLAIECLARLDETGATVDAVDRLASTSFDAVDGSRIAVTEMAREDDRAGGRMIAFGRIGPDAAAVRIGLADGSTVAAAAGAGWWVAWWPGAQLASRIEAVDQASAVTGSAEAPKDVVEARVGPAAWWLDPTAEAPTTDSTAVAAMVLEEACASGTSGADRLDPPTIDLSDTGVTITLWIRRQPGPQACQDGNEPFGYTILLPEPLDDRTLFDGSETPPREAAKPPTG